MATVDENLKTFLQADSNITRKVGVRIHENYFHARPALPFIYFVQTGDDDELCLGDAPGSGPFRHQFAVECVAKSVGESRDLATLVKTRLNKLAQNTEFGDMTIQGCFCENQQDDYQPRTGDLGFYVASLSAEVIP